MTLTTTRRALAALALAALVASAGCTGFVGGTDGLAGDSGDGANPQATAAEGDGSTTAGKTISVGAQGTVTADPDRAVLHLAVRSTADSASAARQRVAENVSALREALADAGIAEENVTTERFDIRQTRESRERSSATRYEAVHALSVEVGDTSRVGELIQVAVDSGATEIRHIEFTLSDATRAQLRERALERAMNNARADAEVLAASADLEIVDVRSASTGGSDVRPYRAEMATAAASGAGGATEIDSGPVTVTAQVQVTYNAAGASNATA